MSTYQETHYWNERLRMDSEYHNARMERLQRLELGMDDFLLVFDFVDRGNNSVYRVFRLADNSGRDTVRTQEIGQMRLNAAGDKVVSYKLLEEAAGG